MLAHPIVIEFIKTYDIITNFKNLITKSLPDNTESGESFLPSLYEKLSQIRVVTFENESLVTPQIVNMTTNVDETLHEIHFVFTKLVDEFIASKFDLIEKDQQLMHLRQQLRPIRSGSLSNMKKAVDFENDQRIQIKVLEQQQNGIKESEMLIKEKEQMLNQKEKEISNLELKLKQKEKFIGEKMKQIEYEETRFIKDKSDFELKRMDTNKSAKQTPITPFTPAPSINQSFYPNLSNLEEKSIANINALNPETQNSNVLLNTINSSRLNNAAAANEEMNQKLNKMKDSYEELEKQFNKETHSYQKEIRFH